MFLMYNMANNSTYLPGLLRGLNELVCITYLEQFLAQQNVSYYYYSTSYLKKHPQLSL